MMKEFIEIIGKRVSTTMVIIGLLACIIAVVNKIPFTEQALSIEMYGRFFIAIVGLAVLSVGVVGAWADSRIKLPLGKPNTAGQEHESLTDAMGLLEEDVIEKIKCKGTLLDTCLGDSERIVEMPDERRWNYELQDVLIKIYKNNRLSLESKALIKTPDEQSMEVYKCFGSGPFVEGVAYITYSFDEINSGSPNWKGVLVLRVPKRGTISGYWMTTNVNRDSKFPIGTIRLRRSF